jgi:hypothetical protein
MAVLNVRYLKFSYNSSGLRGIGLGYCPFGGVWIRTSLGTAQEFINNKITYNLSTIFTGRTVLFTVRAESSMWHLHALKVQVIYINYNKFQGLAALKWHTGHRSLLQVTDSDRLDNKYSLSIVLNVLRFGANTELLKSFQRIS